jgi:HAD superfamily hydrolase (TIGR01509 family)
MAVDSTVMGELRAVVFDFDGLIVDSEMPIFEMSRAALAELGHDITVESWSSVVGLGDADSHAALCAAVGAEVDRDAFDRGYQRQDRSWRDTLDPLPGVVDLLTALTGAGVACGVASSSSAGWVVGHLERLGLAHHFGSFATSDRVGGRTKPAPDAYLLACRDLGTDPAQAVALEDSAHGVAAALAAGLAVVAVPSAITVHTDLSAAHHSVPSLADLTVEHLRALVTSATPQP